MKYYILSLWLLLYSYGLQASQKNIFFLVRPTVRAISLHTNTKQCLDESTYLPLRFAKKEHEYRQKIATINANTKAFEAALNNDIYSKSLYVAIARSNAKTAKQKALADLRKDIQDIIKSLKLGL